MHSLARTNFLALLLACSPKSVQTVPAATEQEKPQPIVVFVSLGPSTSLPNLDASISDVAGRDAQEVWIARLPDGTVRLLLKRVALFRDDVPEILIDAVATSAFPGSDPTVGPGLRVNVPCRKLDLVSIERTTAPGVVMDRCGHHDEYTFTGGADDWVEAWANAGADRDCPGDSEACSIFLLACLENDSVLAIGSPLGPAGAFQIVEPNGTVGAAMYRSVKCRGLRLPGLNPM